MATDRGRTLLDVGGDAGMFVAGLAEAYRRVEAVATSVEAARWRVRNAALNGGANITVHLPKGLRTTPAAAAWAATVGTTGTTSTTAALGAAAAAVARPPWSLATLDDAGFIELDLVVISADDIAAVLHGLAHTIARDRPLLLLLAAADGSDSQPMGHALDALGYVRVATVPRSPGAVPSFWSARTCTGRTASLSI